MTGNAVVLNFSGGETSPRSRGRFDQPWYQTSVKKMLNFVAELQGPARFRTGFVYAGQTRLGAPARMVDFVINDTLAYLLEFTPGYMRVRNPATQQLLTSVVAAISGITQASPAVATVLSAAGLANGQEVILSNVTGAPGLNNKQFLIANLSGTTFNLADPVTGVLLNTSAYPAAATGGIASVVYEVTTPYSATDLLSIQWATDGSQGVMYIVCPTEAPQKLVYANGAFSIGTFTRTNDPFSVPNAAVLSLTGLSLGPSTVATFASGTIRESGTYTFASVGGTTQINGNSYSAQVLGTGSEVIATSVSGLSALAGQTVKVQISGLSGPAAAYLNGRVIYAWVIANGSNQAVILYYDAAKNFLFEIPPNVSIGNYTETSFTIAVQSGPQSGNNYTFSAPLSFFAAPTYSSPTRLLLSGTSQVNSSSWTAYTSGGTATPVAENPLSVTFYEGRLVYGGTNLRPACLFLSMSPDNNGNSQYDNFTGGSNADNACFFQLAPSGGVTDYVSWIRGGPDYLFCGTFGGPYRISGSGLDIPITPSSINVRQFDTAGCEATMAAGLQEMFFIQRGGATIRSIKVINPYLATFESADLCLNAEQVGYSPLQRIALQRGRPDTLWSFRADGELVGMSVHLTTQQADALTGWHRHAIGGGGQVQDIAIIPRQTGYDQLWVCVQRTIGGVTRCYVEVQADDVVFPDPEDFYASSGPIVRPSDNPSHVSNSATDGSQAADLQNWANAVWRLQANYVHVDAEASYDGSLRGVNAAATITPSAVGAVQTPGQAAVPITLTASASVFAASDVGSEIWVKPDLVTGLGAGRATITGYTDSQHVTAVVTVPFSSTAAVAAGDWYFAVSTFYGFGHLEGAQVAVVVDGAVFSDGGQTGDPDFPAVTVAQGTITLPAGDLGQQPRAAVLRAGLPYTGVIETHNLEMGGQSGPAQAKARNISDINARFMSSLGCEYGTSLYAMERINHRLSNSTFNRPAPVFSGIRRLKLEDTWSSLDDSTREKNVCVIQRLPLPAVVQSLDLSYNTADDRGAE